MSGRGALGLKDFDEYLRNEVKQSQAPGPLVGAMAAEPADKLVSYLRLPESVLPKVPVCLETVSRDGRYFARGHLLPQWIKEHRGVVQWTYADDQGKPSRYAAYLSELDPKELAVLATVGACDAEGQARSIAVVGRAGVAAGPGDFVLYVLKPDHVVEVRYTDRAGVARVASCSGIPNKASASSFDKVCLLPAPSRPVTEVVISSRRGKREQTESYTLMYAEP